MLKCIKQILIPFAVLMLTSCNSVVENKNIPYASVKFTIDVSIAGCDNELRDGLTGNAKIFTKEQPAKSMAGYGYYGYSGVVVVRTIDNALCAFDMCCPYEVKKDVALKLDGYFMECPTCGSQFSIGNGSGYVNKGPATEPLKKYHVYGVNVDKYSVVN